MKYIINKDSKSQLILKANNTDLQERWVVQRTFDTKSGDSNLRKTNLAVCEDQFMERTVLAKTVEYDENELGQVESIKMRRRAIAAQVDVLNNVASNMLPEPLDFFFVDNTCDNFTGEAKQLKDNEPVLILDYIPGDVLASKLNYSQDKTFYRVEYRSSKDEKSTFSKSTENINVGAVMRLIGDILTFEMDLYEKSYAYTSLSPDHIVLLGDNKPRFVGLGRICKINNDNYDINHINYGRQLKGYSAPEFNTKESDFGMNESVKAAIAYNLGVLIVSLMLSKTRFENNELFNGAYDYINDAKSRREIQKINEKVVNKTIRGEQVVDRFGTGWMIDSLICSLMDRNPSKRLTNFSSILFELAVISGDATKEKKNKEPIHYGSVKRFFWDREVPFGFVYSGGTEYFVPLNSINNKPTGYSDERVAFTLRVNKKGDIVVKDFIIPVPKPPRTDKVFPRMVPKPEPVMQPVKPKPQPKPAPQPVPKPQPQPVPRPQPTPQPTTPPQPEKKGFFARLFGL